MSDFGAGWKGGRMTGRNKGEYMKGWDARSAHIKKMSGGGRRGGGAGGGGCSSVLLIGAVVGFSALLGLSLGVKVLLASLF